MARRFVTPCARIWGALALAFVAVAGIPLSPAALAQTQATPPAAAGAADLKRFKGSVVQLESRSVQGAPSAETLGVRRSGSGVVIGQQLVLTIGYLLLEVESVDVISASGKRIPANVAGYDHATGFGLVRTLLPVDGRALEMGDSDQVREGQKVLTLGHGEDEATGLLVVSRKPFAGSWEYLIERPIYTFPPVNNWSGSALMTEDGKLVGIGSLIVNDAAAEQRGVPGNLFVPINLLKPILPDLVADGRRKAPVQPWLGMSTEQVRGHLMVVRVAPNGPADGAGIDPGDIIVGIGQEPITDLADFYRRLWKLGPAGTEVTLRVLKGGEMRDLKLRSIDRTDSLRRPTGV